MAILLDIENIKARAEREQNEALKTMKEVAERMGKNGR